MRFKGNITRTEETVAKRTSIGVEVKQKFTMNLSSAVKTSSGFEGYGYGSLTFTMHQSEVAELGISLDKKYNLIILPEEDDYIGRTEEDLRFELEEVKRELATLKASVERKSASSRNIENRLSEQNDIITTLRFENSRLLNENISLKTIFQPSNDPKRIGELNTTILEDLPSSTV